MNKGALNSLKGFAMGPITMQSFAGGQADRVRRTAQQFGRPAPFPPARNMAP